jgi:hypothetical protein
VEQTPAPEQGDHLPEEAAEQAEPGAAYWTALLAAGVAVAPLARSAVGQWGVVASAGPALRLDQIRLTATLELGLYPGIDLNDSGARVHYHEIAAGLALGAARRVSSVWLGARTGPTIAFANATGYAPSGARGEPQDMRISSWLFGLEAQLELGAGFGVGLGCDVHAYLRRQRFAIDSAEVADLGRVRPFARALLTWTPGSRD